MYISSDLQNIINYMKTTPQPPEILFWGRFTTPSTLSLVITFILIGIVIILIAFQIIYFRSKCKKEPKVTLRMSSWKDLQQKLQSQPTAPEK